MPMHGQWTITLLYSAISAAAAHGDRVYFFSLQLLGYAVQGHVKTRQTTIFRANLKTLIPFWIAED